MGILVSLYDLFFGLNQENYYCGPADLIYRGWLLAALSIKLFNINPVV